MTRRWMNAQADLFENPTPETAGAIAPDQRKNVLEQIQALLTEAMTVLGSGSGADDDQNKA